MWQPDPIVEEIHAVRDAIAQESGYDIRKIAQAAREREARSGRKVVTLEPRKPEPARKAS